MKLTKPLRDYIQFRTDKGSNMAAFADALDQIEAYIEALEIKLVERQQKSTPERVLLAKLIVACFESVDFVAHGIAMQSLDQLIRMRADHWVGHDWHSMDIRNIMVEEQAKRIKKAVMQTVDDLIHTQNMHGTC